MKFIYHLRQSKTWACDAACAVESGRSYENGAHAVSPKDFNDSIKDGSACKKCIPIYNRRKAEQLKRRAKHG